MRHQFPGYYHPTDEEFLKAWQEGLFSFDTNVLIDLYRYTPPGRDGVLRTLNALRDRIWLPHQVAQEYHNRRPDEILTQIDIHTKITKILESAKESIAKLKRRSPIYYVNALSEPVATALDRLIGDIHGIQQDFPNYLHDDPIRDELSNLFDGKVGHPYSEKDLKARLEDAKKRYDSDIPPGFRNKKVGSYGDALLWFQLIDHAKEVKKPMIFVTGESHEDWWWQLGGKTLGPRPEMVAEMQREAEVLYYQYNVERFLFHGKDMMGIVVVDRAIQEAKELREARERHRTRTPFRSKEIALWYLQNPNADPVKAQLIRDFRELMEQVFAMFGKDKSPVTEQQKKTTVEEYERMREVYYALLRSIQPEYEQHLKQQQAANETTEQ